MTATRSVCIGVHLWFCLFLVADAEEWVLPPEKPAFKSGAGAELVQANCLVCHSSEYITTQPPLTRDGWKASIVKMQQKYGAPIAAEQVEPLLDYLVSRYGKRTVP